MTVAKLIHSRTTRQAAGFAGSNALVSALGAVAMAVLARSLSPSSFGSFSFAVSFLTFAGILFELGLFVPAARLAAAAEGRTKREIVGASLLIFVPIALGFGVTVFALSFVVDEVFDVQAGAALRAVAPLAFVYPFAQLGLMLAQGLDRLHLYSLSAAGAHLLFVAVLVSALAAMGSISVTVSLLLRSAAFLAGWTVLVILIAPAFTTARGHVRTLVRHARSWGFRVYIGRVVGIGTYNMDVLMLAGFAGSTEVGVYTLAAAIAAAMGLPSLGIANALFPRMVRERTINRRAIEATAALGVAGVVVLAVVAEPLVGAVFSARYLAAAALVLPLALAEALRGVTSVFNSFLSAHARGKALQNAAFVLMGSNLLLNFALIPPFGAVGAAWASMLALAANLVAHVVFYRRSVNSLETAVT